MHHDELYDTISMREEEIAELEAAVLREKRRVDSLHIKINELEAENEALKHDVTRQMAIANELAQWQEEARVLLAEIRYAERGVHWWLEPKEAQGYDWIERRDALLEGDMGIPTSEGVGNE